MGDDPADLKQFKAMKDEFYTWDEYNEELLRRRLSTPEFSDEYGQNLHWIVGGEHSPAEELQELRDDIATKIRRLQSIRSRLALLDDPGGVLPAERRPETGTGIFVVHGRALGRKDEVARLLEQLGLDPIVLHERPNQGRTVLEKFEEHAQKAGYAVVLLTADDVGAQAGARVTKPRARQNVVFELGFFFGALGRGRVAVLYEAGVELPSDIGGLAYIPIDDAGAWKVLLAKELKHANFAVDLNRAL
jgi:predicted nucleotide-binding protein with TIR-like domain